jgi:uncharacterized protein YecE (DUF72 family)
MVSASILAGASGYAFKEWKGAFYPDDVKADDMLAFYAERLPTVEINNTFYRMPRAEVLANWAAATPAHFRFAIKASRRITHITRLKAEAAEPLGYLYRNLDSLGDKRGPVLFQLPPNLKKDLALFDAFLETFPPRVCAAFEFRHPSWFDDEVFGRLRGRGLALCVADSEKLSAPVEITAPYAYFRLRDEGYTPADIERWAGVVRGLEGRCDDVFVYFKHEEAGKGPEFGEALMALLATPPLQT